MKRSIPLLLTALVGAGGCSDARPNEAATSDPPNDPPLADDESPDDADEGGESSDAGNVPDLPAEPEPMKPPRASVFDVDYVTVLPGELLPDLVVVSAFDNGELIAELTLTSLQNGEVLQGVADFPASWRRKRESLYTGVTEHVAEGEPLTDAVYLLRLAQIRDALEPQVLASPCVDRFVSWLADDDYNPSKTLCECVAWLKLARPGETIELCED